jgi:type VI secretion system protein ImpM
MTALYGKLPAKGDFLSRNLPREFIDTWDDWLQSGMNASRQALGEGWLEIYLTSPLWRFVLPAGVCGENAWCGVVMPSMDKVGRYFPMAVVRKLPPDLSPICVATQNDNWFESVETILLDALDNESLDLDEFDKAIEAITFSETDVAVVENPLETGAGVRVSLPENQGIAKTLLAYSAPEVQQRTAGLTAFWGNGSELVGPGILLSKGLPGAKMFTALLSGNWDAHGWRNADAKTAGQSADPLALLLDDLVN